jgi:ribosome-interacting GTPase 1
MKRTQKNKATEGHLGSLKAKLAKLRTEVGSLLQIASLLVHRMPTVYVCSSWKGTKAVAVAEKVPETHFSQCTRLRT